jgi:hypothetical protein
MSTKGISKDSSVSSKLPPYVANEGQQFPFLMSEDCQERVNIAWRVETAESQ